MTLVISTIDTSAINVELQKQEPKYKEGGVTFVQMKNVNLATTSQINVETGRRLRIKHPRYNDAIFPEGTPIRYKDPSIPFIGTHPPTFPASLRIKRPVNGTEEYRYDKVLTDSSDNYCKTIGSSSLSYMYIDEPEKVTFVEGEEVQALTAIVKDPAGPTYTTTVFNVHYSSDPLVTGPRFGFDKQDPSTYPAPPVGSTVLFRGASYTYERSVDIPLPPVTVVGVSTTVTGNVVIFPADWRIRCEVIYDSIPAPLFFHRYIAPGGAGLDADGSNEVLAEYESRQVIKGVLMTSTAFASTPTPGSQEEQYKAKMDSVSVSVANHLVVLPARGWTVLNKPHELKSTLNAGKIGRGLVRFSEAYTSDIAMYVWPDAPMDPLTLTTEGVSYVTPYGSLTAVHDPLIDLNDPITVGLWYDYIIEVKGIPNALAFYKYAFTNGNTGVYGSGNNTVLRKSNAISASDYDLYIGGVKYLKTGVTVDSTIDTYNTNWNNSNVKYRIATDVLFNDYEDLDKAELPVIGMFARKADNQTLTYQFCLEEARRDLAAGTANPSASWSSVPDIELINAPVIKTYDVQPLNSTSTVKVALVTSADPTLSGPVLYRNTYSGSGLPFNIPTNPIRLSFMGVDLGSVDAPVGFFQDKGIEKIAQYAFVLPEQHVHEKVYNVTDLTEVRPDGVYEKNYSVYVLSVLKDPENPANDLLYPRMYKTGALASPKVDLVKFFLFDSCWVGFGTGVGDSNAGVYTDLDLSTLDSTQSFSTKNFSAPLNGYDFVMYLPLTKFKSIETIAIDYDFRNIQNTNDYNVADLWSWKEQLVKVIIAPSNNTNDYGLFYNNNFDNRTVGLGTVVDLATLGAGFSVDYGASSYTTAKNISTSTSYTAYTSSDFETGDLTRPQFLFLLAIPSTAAIDATNGQEYEGFNYVDDVVEIVSASFKPDLIEYLRITSGASIDPNGNTDNYSDINEEGIYTISTTKETDMVLKTDLGGPSFRIKKALMQKPGATEILFGDTTHNQTELNFGKTLSTATGRLGIVRNDTNLNTTERNCMGNAKLAFVIKIPRTMKKVAFDKIEIELERPNTTGTIAKVY